MMDLLSPVALLRLARDSVSNPRGGARDMMALDLPRPVLLHFYLLLQVLSAMVKVIYFAISPAPEGVELPPNASISFTLFEAIIGLVGAFAAYRIGRAFGGSGTFDQALTLVTWAQFILFLVNIVQLGVLLILPPMVDLINIAAIALFFWLMVNFVSELHGFKSPGLVFVGILLSIFALAILLSIVFSAIGLRLV